MKFHFVVLVLGLLASVAASAYHCPADMQKIDAILAERTDLATDVREKAQALREEGEALHGGGDHDKAVQVLGEALELLGDK